MPRTKKKAVTSRGPKSTRSSRKKPTKKAAVVKGSPSNKKAPSRSAKPRTAVRSRRSGKLTLLDRLSRLTFVGACQLLGENGKELIHQGSRYDSVDVDRDVFLGKDLFRLSFAGCGDADETDAVVTITLTSSARKRLQFKCNVCAQACKHVGAALSLILEEKSLLGLAEPALEDIPFELLDHDQLVQLALSERETRAKTEKFRIKSADSELPWTDYVVSSAGSGKSYRVALRGEERGISYCSCPDFRTNYVGNVQAHHVHIGPCEVQVFDQTTRQKTEPRTFFSARTIRRPGTVAAVPSDKAIGRGDQDRRGADK